MNARVEDAFDWRHPQYGPIIRARVERLNRLRANPVEFRALHCYYRTHVADFISDWGMTYSPHNVGTSIPVYLPFLLQPKQRELVEWILERWRNRETAIIEKSRDVGVSWIAMATSIALCIFWPGISIGFGSATEDKLDQAGNPDSLFWKGRLFVRHLPVEFRGGCEIERDAPDKRILFPATGSTITGDVGDRIGIGGRKSIYFIDEAAYLQHPKLAESGTSGATPCRIDISSPSLDGTANEFAIRRMSGKYKVFTYHYRDDLRKDEAWREQTQKGMDPVIWAANYEIDYMAATEGAIIPQLWVRAAIDAHLKLKIEPSGVKRGALDIADLGRDLNCFGARHGLLVNHCEVWAGEVNKPIFATVERAYLLCDRLKLEGFDYDADGMGAGARSDVYRIQERRLQEQHLPKLRIKPFRASDAVFRPDAVVTGTERTAKDLFQNLKAQSYFLLRQMFQETCRAIQGEPFDAEKIISLDSRIKDLDKLCIELSQPIWKMSVTGKMMVDKTPDGMPSPNRADTVMMLFAPRSKPMNISDEFLGGFDAT